MVRRTYAAVLPKVVLRLAADFLRLEKLLLRLRVAPPGPKPLSVLGPEICRKSDAKFCRKRASLSARFRADHHV